MNVSVLLDWVYTAYASLAALALVAVIRAISTVAKIKMIFLISVFVFVNNPLIDSIPMHAYAHIVGANIRKKPNNAKKN